MHGRCDRVGGMIFVVCPPNGGAGGPQWRMNHGQWALGRQGQRLGRISMEGEEHGTCGMDSLIKKILHFYESSLRVDMRIDPPDMGLDSSAL